MRSQQLLYGAIAICASAREAAASYVRVPASPFDPVAASSPAILYLNDCKPSGCTLKPGMNDSRTNTSSLVTTQRTLSPFSGTQATWDSVVDCVRTMYAPFGIDVVTTDPGAMTPHFEEMVAGTSTQIGFPGGVLGVSPFTCDVIPNAITFTFANATPDDVLGLCWTVAQESAHAFGLEHSMTAADAMTYIASPPQKSFVDATGCIGTQGCCQPAQECQCGRTTINSYQRLMTVLGPRPTPPAITITAPQDGESVAAGFGVDVDVVDPDGVALVELAVDGAVVATLTAPPFHFTTDPALADGEHAITVRSEDMLGAVGSAGIAVVREPEPELEQPEAEAGCGCDSTENGGATSSSLLVLALAALLRRRSRLGVS